MKPAFIRLACHAALAVARRLLYTGAVDGETSLMMVTKRLLLALFLSVSLAACAAQKSMKRGDQLMAAGNYEGAFDAYRDAANRKPGNTKFEQKLEQARQAVTKESLRLAEEALQLRDYDQVRRMLDRADAYSEGSAPTGEIRQRAQAAAETDARTLLADQDYWGAYDMAFRSASLFGVNNDLIQQVRSDVDAAAADADGAKEYPQAWDLYRMIVQFEPNQAVNYQSKINGTRKKWVAELRAGASAHQDDRNDGFAALNLAVADALEGGSSKRWKEISVDLRNEHDLRFGWKTAGASGLVGPTRTVLAEVLGVSGSKPSMLLQATLRDGCSQSSQTRTDTKDYLAGTRWVPNPKKQQLGTQLEQERAMLERELDQLAASKRQYEQALAQSNPVIQQHNNLVQQKNQLVYERQQAETQLQQDQYYLEDTRRKYQQMKAQSDGTSSGLMTWEKLVWEAEAKAQQSQNNLNQIDDTIRKIEYEIDRLNADGYERETLNAQQRLESDLREAQDQEARVVQLENAYNAEPDQIEEEIWETLRYPVEIVTRTCTVEAKVTARGVIARSITVRGARQTSDEAHDAYPVASVQADPLRLPAGDDALVATASEDAAAEVKSLAQTWRRDAYAQMLRPSSDENRDVERFIGICQARPDMLTSDSRSRVVQIARKQVKGFDAVAASADHVLDAVCLQ